MKSMNLGALQLVLAASAASVRPTSDPVRFFYDEADELVAEAVPPESWFDVFPEPVQVRDLPTSQPLRKRQSVRTDLAAPTFKSKRVKANRKRKRLARKARRAVA